MNSLDKKIRKSMSGKQPFEVFLRNADTPSNLFFGGRPDVFLSIWILFALDFYY